MPELPEVTTTVNEINSVAKNLIIEDVWSDWPKLIKSGKFSDFVRDVVNKKILVAERRAKNILIKLSGNKTVLIHMKMTGHIMYGKWRPAKKNDDPKWKWIPINDDHTHPPRLGEAGPMNDPYNRFIHLMIGLSNGYQLALSDSRKFAKVLLLDSDKLDDHPDLKTLGPEPLDNSVTLEIFTKQLNKKSHWPIKQALTEQSLIAGIGNIYSDEILWEAGVHPLQKVGEISDEKMKQIYLSMKRILKRSIELGGDSMSDYRNIHGERGNYQKEHLVYRRTGEKCLRKGCAGTITRIKIGGRGAHFCSAHQRLK